MELELGILQLGTILELATSQKKFQNFGQKELMI
jgi:hypothetical protein